jgi:hypothetical protein
MGISRRSESLKIGIIAEDDSDVAVLQAIIEKYTDKSSFSIRKFVGNGCGRLRNKCQTWAETLVDNGCKFVILVHDLDRSDEQELRRFLEQKIPQTKFPNSLIVIPIEELEAWLLSDADALKSVFSLKKKPKRIPNCEVVLSPKEAIARLIWSMAKKRYLNTVHNLRIAEKTTLVNLRRCSSFLPLDNFLRKKVFPAGA